MLLKFPAIPIFPPFFCLIKKRGNVGNRENFDKKRRGRIEAITKFLTIVIANW